MSHGAIQGHCPMGCGVTLFVGEGGHVTCSRKECPNPAAVDEILAQPETEHIVLIEEGLTSTLQHPLRERVGGDLFGCALAKHLSHSLVRPSKPGRYRVVQGEEGWTWTELR